MESFAEWFTGRRLVLLRFAAALCGDAGTAQEVVQEVALRASRRWARIQRLEHPDAYLRRMVINEHLSWRRKWGRMLASSDLVDSDGRSGPDEMGRVDDRHQLRAGLLTLTARERTVIVLRFYAGLTDAEIAEELRCPRGTVRSLQTRALRRLRIGITDSEDPRSTVPSPPTSAVRRRAPLSYERAHRQES